MAAADNFLIKHETMMMMMNEDNDVAECQLVLSVDKFTVYSTL
jgi:hypothetical protein